MRYAELITDLGKIVLELDDEKAPKSVAYFCGHIKSGEFSDCHFYRVVKKNPVKDAPPTIDVVQGGVGWNRCGDLLSVELETTTDTGLIHKDGTLSLARSESDVSASEFFICIGDQPTLDYGGTEGAGHDGFAAFGRVIEGMDVVRAIHKFPANSLPPGEDKSIHNDFLDKVIKIKTVLVNTNILP